MLLLISLIDLILPPKLYLYGPFWPIELVLSRGLSPIRE